MGRVFISYAREDFDIAERLYRDLKDAGANPWMDVKNLVAGKRWKSAIQREIRESSHILVLLSSRALSKRGFVQKEINQALEVWAEVPPDKIYLIPVRLDECTPDTTSCRKFNGLIYFLRMNWGYRKSSAHSKLMMSSQP